MAEVGDLEADDLDALHRHRATVTGDPLPLIALFRAGVSCWGLDAAYTPEDLLGAWQTTADPAPQMEVL